MTQAAYLDRYGYPYVLDEFRFHMTLTGRLSEADRQEVLQALRKKVMNHLPVPTLAIASISIVRQRSKASSFRVVHQSLLGGWLIGRERSPSIQELQRRISNVWE